MITRRRFLASLPALYAAPVRPQSPERAGKPARVGILERTTAAKNQRAERRFAVVMHELGWREGRNIVYDSVHANDDVARLPGLAAALVSRRPGVIYTTTSEPLQAVLAKTRTIPIVMGSFDDPAEFGIQDLAHPGGNVTGITNLGIELGAKRLQLLKQAVPRITRVGVLTQPHRTASLKELELIEQAASALGVAVTSAGARDPADLGAALAALFASSVEAVLTTHQDLFAAEQRRIVGLAMRQRIPVVAHRSQMASAGALLTYNSALTDQIRRAAQLVDRILKGAKPADLPVEQPRFELVINLRTAKALGITIPPSFVLHADRLIK